MWVHQVEFRDEIKQCVDAIRQVELDPIKYQNMLALPKVPNNRLEGTVFDVRTIALSLRSVLRSYKSYLVEAF